MTTSTRSRCSMLRSFILGVGTLVLVAAPGRLVGQVRPDLDWRTIRTMNFRVHFTPELEELARRTAAHAEAAFAQLAQELTPPRGVVDIVLADNADYANGYATPFPSNRIVVYARPPVEEMALRNHRDWNEIVVTHELAHIFHLDRARGLWGLGQRVFGRAAPLFPNTYAPSWILEGLAVHYETVLTGGGRLAGTEFPATARGVALDGRLPALDALSQATPRFPGGHTSYLYGSFLFDQREPDAMRRFVETSSGRLLPWRHDANARTAFGRSFSELWQAWRDSVERTARDPRAPTADAATRVAAAPGWNARFPRYLDDGALVYVGNDAKRSTGLYRIASDGDVARLGRRNGIDVSSPRAGAETLRGELDFTDPYTLRSDLHVGSGARRRRLTRGARLSHPDVHAASGRVVAVRTEPGTTSLVVLEPTGGEIDGASARVIAAGTLDRTWSEPRWSRDGARIAAARWERGGRTSIVVLDATGRELIAMAPARLTRRLTIVSSPVFEPGDTTLLFVSDHEGRSMIYRGDVRTGGYARVWASATGLNTPDISRDGRRVAAVELHGEGDRVVTRDMPVAVPLTRSSAGPSSSADAPFVPVTPDQSLRVERYSPWSHLAPNWWLPVLAEGDLGTMRVGAMSSGRDLVGRHAWAAEASHDLENPELTMAASYAYGRLGNPVLLFGAEEYWRHGTITSSGTPIGTLAQRTREVTVDLVFSRPRQRLSSFASVGAEVAWVDYGAYPSDTLLNGLGNATLLRTTSFPTAVASVGFSTMQRPGLSVSSQDGLALTATTRRRFRSGVNFEDVQEIVVSANAAKSIPLPGFARHVIAVRAAIADAPSYTTSAFSAGGVSGSSLEIIPGFAIGDSPRTFFVRGFEGSAQVGSKAAAASVEYRAPLSLVGRGIALLPVFLQKVSLTAFADAGAAWCADTVQFSGLCRTGNTVRQTMASIGGELTLDAALQYDVLYRFRLGAAHPVRGESFAPRATTIYFTIGSTF